MNQKELWSPVSTRFPWAKQCPLRLAGWQSETLHQRLADEADDFIFGYTCVNDITGNDILDRDPTFPQWARAKGIDDYGPFGPAIVTGLDPPKPVVRTILNGAERRTTPYRT